MILYIQPQHMPYIHRYIMPLSIWFFTTQEFADQLCMYIVRPSVYENLTKMRFLYIFTGSSGCFNNFFTQLCWLFFSVNKECVKLAAVKTLCEFQSHYYVQQKVTLCTTSCFIEDQKS